MFPYGRLAAGRFNKKDLLGFIKHESASMVRAQLPTLRCAGRDVPVRTQDA